MNFGFFIYNCHIMDLKLINDSTTLDHINTVIFMIKRIIHPLYHGGLI